MLNMRNFNLKKQNKVNKWMKIIAMIVGLEFKLVLQLMWISEYFSKLIRRDIKSTCGKQ